MVRERGTVRCLHLSHLATRSTRNRRSCGRSRWCKRRSAMQGLRGRRGCVPEVSGLAPCRGDRSSSAAIRWRSGLSRREALSGRCPQPALRIERLEVSRPSRRVDAARGSKSNPRGAVGRRRLRPRRGGKIWDANFRESAGSALPSCAPIVGLARCRLPRGAGVPPARLPKGSPSAWPARAIATRPTAVRGLRAATPIHAEAQQPPGRGTSTCRCTLRRGDRGSRIPTIRLSYLRWISCAARIRHRSTIGHIGPATTHERHDRTARRLRARGLRRVTRLRRARARRALLPRVHGLSAAASAPPSRRARSAQRRARLPDIPADRPRSRTARRAACS